MKISGLAAMIFEPGDKFDRSSAIILEVEAIIREPAATISGHEMKISGREATIF